MDKLKRERTPLRNTITRTTNEIKSGLSLEEVDIILIRAKFERLTILNDRLILIDDKIKEILLDDPRSTEAQINDEMELCETYSLQVGIVAQKRNGYHGGVILKKIHLDESLSDVDKFEYLIQSMVVGSKAHRLVTSFPLTQKNYNKVIGDLKDRFGDRDMLTELYVRKLLKLVIASARSEKRTLAQLYDDLVAHLHSLGSLGVDTKSGGGAFLYPLVESSLPLELIKIWQCSRTPYIEAGIENSGAKAFDKLEGLIEFLKQEVKNAERISFVAEGFEPSLPLKQGNRDNNPPKIHTASALFVGKTNLPCLFCDKDNHLSQNCFKAAKMLESDRLKRVQDAKVCFKCLRNNHLKKDCRSFVRCKRCQGPHFEIMCRGTSHSQENLNWRSDNRSHNSLAEQNEGISEPVTAMANQVCTNNISLMTLIVKLKGPKRSKMVRVLLDSGSQKSYIRRSLAKELDLPKVGEVKLNKFLFGGQTTEEKAHSIFHFQLDNVDEGKAFKMEALEETIICGNISPVETGPRQWELDKKGITLTKVDNNKTVIDILIGGDYYGQLLTGKIEQLAGGLTAIQTVLGWTLIGNTSSERPETSAQMVITLLTTQQRVTSLWELETKGIRDPTEVISEKEKNVLMQEKFRDKICRGHDGRYPVSLPWKEGIGTIPNNLEIAKRRLKAMTQKLTQKGQFVPYNDVLRSWFRENLIEEVDGEDIKPIGHYLPHRPIYKVQSETTPIRPVYDASCNASKRSLSLNECLETGPNLIELLPEILIRFREKKIGAIADIRKAFQTVGIDEKERFHKEYLAMLVQKRNETEGRRFLPGEVVLIGRDDQKRIFWPLGRILELYPGKDCRERVARVRTATGEFVRPLKRLFSMELGSDISREVRLPKTEGIKAQEIPTDGEQSIFTRSGREVKKPTRLGIRRMDRYLASVDEEKSGGDLHKLKLIEEGITEIKTETKILFDELFDQEEVYEDKELEGYEAIQDKMEKLELRLRRALEGMQSTADTKQTKGIETVILPKFELPHFYRDANSWFNFKEVFGMTIDQNPGLNDLQRLQYLGSAVKGEAAKLIRGFPISSESYRQAWDTLVSRYDNQRELAYAQLNKIFKIKQMKSPSAKALRELLDTCNESVRNLESLGLQRNEMVDIILVQFLRNRIDEDMKRQWELTQDERSFPCYEDFVLFLERQARSLPQGSGEYQRKENEIQRNYANVHLAINASAKICIACKAGHRIYNCTTFSTMPIEQKWEFVKQHKMCYNCLKRGHTGKNCYQGPCKKCNKRHHTLLHRLDTEVTNTQKGAKPQIFTPVSEINNTSIEQGSETINQVLLATAQIIVEGENGTQLICRALMDSGSQVSLITKEMCWKLGLKGETSRRSLRGIGNNPVQVSTTSVDLTFRSIYRSEIYETNALVMEVLTTEIPNFKLAEPTWIMQRGLELADPLFHISAPIDIILGAEMYAYLMQGEKKILGRNQPIAMKSRLGWILMGKVEGSLSSSYKGGPCSLAVQTTSELDGLVGDFKHTESVPSLQDQNPREVYETYYQKTYSRGGQGRFSVKLLLRKAHQNSSIPTSRSPIIPLGERSGEGVLRRSNLDSRRSFRETNRLAGPSSHCASRSELKFSGGG
ncbi:hypothetical protein LAZ67_11003269, partial [Cordylochernes scorpioides]